MCSARRRPAGRRPAIRTAPAVGAGVAVAVLLAGGAAPAAAQRARPLAAPAGADTVPPAPWERRSAVRFALGGGGLFQAPTGGRTGGTDGGGFDAFGALQVSALSVGVGYQRTSHALRGGTGGRALFHGVFVEPRVSVAPFRNFTPYLAGRAAFLRQRLPAAAAPAPGSQSLTALGAGVGTLVWLAPSVQLDLAGMYTDVRGGRSARLDTSAGGFGRGALVRAGLVLGLDNWGR